MPFNVLVADDHFPVRFGIEILVRETLGNATHVDFAKDSVEVIEKTGQKQYDILISDINMPGTDGIAMVKQVLTIWPGIKILMVSINPQEIFAPRYIKAGVYGYIHKADSDSELRRAIRSLSLGKRYFTDGQSNEIKDISLDRIVDNPFTKLSTRELEVATLLLKGNGAADIAKILSLNPSTASTYKGRILEKLKVKNVMELAALAKKFNIAADDTSFY